MHDARIIPAYAGSTMTVTSIRSTASDHPRIRGEHCRTLRLGCLQVRIIPAYAGSTPAGTTGSSGARDHPRIRGEHVVRIPVGRPPRGSSPHTRGARYQGRIMAFSFRIIPAYAGSTSSALPTSTRRADHPRIRGEHRPTGKGPSGGAGSSPHTRGARGDMSVYFTICGIIPAYAGSTKMKQKGKGKTADHPRIRGEHTLDSPTRHPRGGSSPHTRGALRRPQSRHRGWRIIPAYAGSTETAWRPHPPRRDHPRIRGEHPETVTAMVCAPGSSPHTRGARCLRSRGSVPGRIIPAYAGSTRGAGAWDRRGRDHPRIRGEHAGRRHRGVGGVGSSPHTRGAPRRRPPHHGRQGIIPAYAGSTCDVPEAYRAD